MAYETRDQSGSLFPNRDKKEDKHPNAKGEAKIDGVLYEVAAWTKTDKNGNKWQSLSFKVKGRRQDTKPAESGLPKDDDMADLPF